MEDKMSWIAHDAEDYKGQPACRAKTGGWVRAARILSIEMVERLTTMGIAVNLVTYLTGTMHLPSSASANIVTDFMGTSFLLCLLGGYVADTFLGRYKTIAIFSIVQAVGTCTLSITTAIPKLRPPPCRVVDGSKVCQEASGLQMSILYIALYCIAMGTGGLKSSVSGFGSDQFDDKDEKEGRQMSFFFSRFFFIISLGTLLAVTVLVWVQDEVGRSWGYGICCVAMFVAVALFLTGTKQYRYKRRATSPINHIVEVVAAAMSKRKLDLPHDTSLLYEDAPDGMGIPHTHQFTCLDKAAIVADGDFEGAGGSKPNPWRLSTVTRVEEVKMMIRLMPIWATTIMFWTIYAQMITFSVEQAATMNRSMGNFQIPSGSLTVFFVAAILISLAVYDRFIIPLCRKLLGKPGFTSLQQMGIGLVLSILGMVTASFVEKKRLSVAGAYPGVSPLPITVFYLVPQFFLIGAGEGFIYSGQLDFFITQSPKGMKTMSTGLFLTTLAFGFFNSSLLVAIVKDVTRGKNGSGWLADTINNGRLDYFYALLAILSAVNYVLFLISAFWYKPVPTNSTSKHIDAHGKC